MSELFSGSRSAVLLIASIALTLTSVGVALGISAGSAGAMLAAALFTLGTAFLAACSYRWSLEARRAEARAGSMVPAPVRVLARR